MVDTLRSGWITSGPKTKRFEQDFGGFVGAPTGGALALNSCTAALHTALVTAGIEFGLLGVLRTRAGRVRPLHLQALRQLHTIGCEIVLRETG